MKLSDIKDVVWTKGSRMSGDAFGCYKELESIKRKNKGVLKPNAIVDRAVNADNILHPIFTWDDSEAAVKFRAEQARKLVRSIMVIRKDKKDTVSRPERMYTSVSSSPVKETTNKVYVGIDEALSDPIMRDEVLSRAIREALAYRKKYAELSELAKVFTAIDETLLNCDAV